MSRTVSCRWTRSGSSSSRCAQRFPRPEAMRCLWRSLLTFQAERARVYLQEGLGLLRSLDGRSSLCVSTFAGLYRATLERIEARGFDVFDGPPQLSALTKLRIVGAGLRR